MKFTAYLSGAVCFVATGLGAREASAQDYPLRLIDRPLTLPQGGFRVDVGFNVAQLSECVSVGGSSLCASSTATDLTVGGAWSPVQDLEVGLVALPLTLSPSVQYNNPSVYGTYRFYHANNIQIGGTLSLSFPVQSGTDFGLGVGVPLWWNFSSMAQLQTGLTYNATFTSPLFHGLTIPLLFNIQLANNFALQPATGVNLPFTSGAYVSFPLSIGAVFSVPSNSGRPLVDLIASFGFPAFLVPADSGNVVGTNLWVIGLGAKVYFLR